MKYIPVDQYVSERHFEDCVVPQGVCPVDYRQQYEGVNPKTDNVVKDNKYDNLKQRIEEVLINGSRQTNR